MPCRHPHPLYTGMPVGKHITKSGKPVNQHVLREMAVQTQSYRLDNGGEYGFTLERTLWCLLCFRVIVASSSKWLDAVSETPTGYCSQIPTMAEGSGWATVGHQPASAARRHASVLAFICQRRGAPSCSITHKVELLKADFPKREKIN